MQKDDNGCIKDKGRDFSYWVRNMEIEAKEEKIAEFEEEQSAEQTNEQPTEKVAKAGKCNAKALKIVGIVALVIVGVLLFDFVLMPLTDFIPRVTGDWTYDASNVHIVFEQGAKISAHRAGGDLAPEETLKAFKTCVEATDYAVNILEFDVHITLDGQLVLLHDDTVNRTSDATEHFGSDEVYAKDKTLSELKELNFGENFCDLNGAYPYRGLRGNDIPDDVRILTLDEILTYLQEVGADLDFIIEIKDGGEDGERAMDALYETMVRYNIVNRTIVGTFEGSVTKYIDEKYPQVTRSASIAEVLHFYMAYLWGDKLTNFKFDVLQIPQGIKGFYDLGSKHFIEFAHYRGVAVQYWTINDAEDIKRLVENGADTIITDNPKVAYDVINGDKQ